MAFVEEFRQSTPNIDPRISAIICEGYLNDVSRCSASSQPANMQNNTVRNKVNTSQKVVLPRRKNRLPEKPINMHQYQDVGVLQSAAVEILVQPERTKFRYHPEPNNPIKGVPCGNIQNKKQYYPTIKITGCKGPGEVWVQCVHPHDINLQNPNSHPNRVIRKPNKSLTSENTSGIAKYELEDMSANQGIITFKDLMFYRARANEIDENMNERTNAYRGIENSVRQHNVRNGDNDRICTSRVIFCFQVFLKSRDGRGNPIFKEIAIAFSNVVEDTQAHPELKIVAISDNVSPKEGGRKIILLCNNIKEQKEDNKIQIHFSYPCDDTGTENVLYGIFEPKNVHHQVAITFTTPEYPESIQPSKHVHVKLRLYKPSANVYSDPFDFVYYMPSNDKSAFIRCIKCATEAGIKGPDSGNSSSNGSIVGDEESARDKLPKAECQEPSSGPKYTYETNLSANEECTQQLLHLKTEPSTPPMGNRNIKNDIRNDLSTETINQELEELQNQDHTYVQLTDEDDSDLSWLSNIINNPVPEITHQRKNDEQQTLKEAVKRERPKGPRTSSDHIPPKAINKESEAKNEEEDGDDIKGLLSCIDNHHI